MDTCKKRHGTRPASAGASRTSVATLVCLIVLSLVVTATAQTSKQPVGCARSDFEQVVDKAAVALSKLNAKKTPTFQSLLRQLKVRRRWSHADFMKYGTPYVQDARIASYDAKTGELLAKITNQGEQGASATTPDCNLLTELRIAMQTLVETQTKKWDYMFMKLDKALKE